MLGSTCVKTKIEGDKYMYVCTSMEIYTQTHNNIWGFLILHLNVYKIRYKEMIYQRFR